MHSKSLPHLADLIDLQEGVALRRDLEACIGARAVRREIDHGRWQRPLVGVVVTHNGPLTPQQDLWVDVLGAGRGAVLAGLTAAQAGGLRGFEDAHSRRWVLVPHGQKGAQRRPGLVVKSSTSLAEEAVLSVARPPRTRIARSLLDAAVWASSDPHAHAVLLAGVQQRLVTPGALAVELTRRRHNLRRGRLIARAVGDAVGGAQTLPEAAFRRLCETSGLPGPDRQSPRRDAYGRRRWLDCEWRAYGLVVEIDGRGHIDLRQWWADMLRDALLVVGGSRVLRFPSFIVREEPELVAALVRQALELGGWQPVAAAA